MAFSDTCGMKLIERIFRLSIRVIEGKYFIAFKKISSSNKVIAFSNQFQ